jgi:Family of unknown function (DUF6492)
MLVWAEKKSNMEGKRRRRDMLTRSAVPFRSLRRESDKGWGYALQWFWRRFYYRIIQRYGFPAPAFVSSDLARPLAVVVPASDKDAPVLPSCLQSVQEMIRHPISSLHVAAPESGIIRRITAEAGATFVPEDEFLPRPASELKTRGWLIQQLIKFNAGFHLSTPDYLVMDADTMFLRPQAFFRRGRTLLKFSDQYELLYNPSLRLLLGTNRRFPVSFVTHHMVFNRERIRRLLDGIERKFGLPWHEVLLHEVDHRRLISLSEFELYGNFAAREMNFSRAFVLRHWRGLDSNHSKANDFTDKCKEHLRKRYDSVSFHSHTQ